MLRVCQGAGCDPGHIQAAHHHTCSACELPMSQCHGAGARVVAVLSSVRAPAAKRA
jgi:hypothetical protein